MRRMYSENQLAKIIADNVGKATSLLNDSIYLEDIDGDIYVKIDGLLSVSNWDSIFAFDNNYTTLQGALDGKSDKLYYHNVSLSDESAENSIGVQLLTKDSNAYTKEQALEHLASFTGKNTEVFYYYNSTTDTVYTDGFITNIRYTGGAHPSLSVGGYALDENNTLVRFNGLSPDINNLINFSDIVVPL